MKKIDKIAIIVSIGLVIVFIFFSKFFMNSIYTFFSGLSQGEPKTLSLYRMFMSIQLIIYTFLFMGMFAYFGVGKAKKNNLNPVKWGLICFFFNILGFICLTLSIKFNKSEI